MKHTIPLVSVIMPTFNRGYIIQRAIDSIKRQSFREYELIIVDDGSDDDTKSVVDANTDTKINYICYKPNRGATYARNIGMKAARGEFIAFLDSDCEWEEDTLEKYVSTFSNDTVADIVFGKTEVRLKDGNSYVFPLPDLPDLSILNDRKILEKYFLENSVMDTNATCISRRCFVRYGGFDETMHRLQDWEYFLRLFEVYGCKATFIDKIMAISYVQEDSISSKGNLFWPALVKIMEINKVSYANNPSSYSKVLLDHLFYFSSLMQDDYYKILGKTMTPDIGEYILRYCAEFFQKQSDDKSRLILQINELIGNINNLDKRLRRSNRIIKIVKTIVDSDLIIEYLKAHDYKNVVIYGYGALGRMLYHQFKNAGVNIVAVIDKTAADEKIEIHRDFSCCDSFDVVLVTVVDHFEEIRNGFVEEISKKMIDINSIVPLG